MKMSRPARIAVIILTAFLICSLWSPTVQEIKWGDVVLETVEPMRTSLRRKAIKNTWRMACVLSQYSCKRLKKPTIVWSNFIPNHWKAFGLFIPGEPNLYVRTNLPTQLTEVVLVHEMVHYLQDKRGEYLTSCAKEAEAFKVGDKYAKRIRRYDLVRGPLWWKPYPRCQNYGMSPE